MTHYYAVCDKVDRELTECALTACFDEGDMLCDGPYAGSMPYDQTAVGFFVKSEDTFRKIAYRLSEEGVGFLDSEGVIVNVEQYD